MDKVNFHISYKDHRVTDGFLRGYNCLARNALEACQDFRENHSKECEIIGLLKSGENDDVDEVHNI